ncbi:MAG: cell division topological specificity factor MinE [Dehalococcoidia bacterium]|tara:strand:+ start:1089 stop:1361 length:273 start_codon:yes stop_codon:yes gene_type:complete
MLELIKWARTRKEFSKETARTRLKSAIAVDRFDLAPDIINALRVDITNAVSRYMVIEEEDQQVRLTRENDSMTLVTSIPVKEVHRWANSS